MQVKKTKIKNLKVGDKLVGIESTTFKDGPCTVVKIQTYRYDGRIFPCAAVTDAGAFFDFNQMGHMIAHVAI